tara:strand:+ start:1649 stop:1843 length:195 start_codon:yes stop_codon:yes gene_type:complete
MQTAVFILIMLAMLGVFASLIIGLFRLSKDGENNRKQSNKMMWWRVWLQGAAILLMFIFASIGS